MPINSSRYANNNELSSARALSVFDYFVDNTNLNSTPEGRAANRRVEIRIYHELSYY